MVNVADATALVAYPLATAIASATWAALEWVIRKKPSVLGFCSGAVAGLVVITPSCGFITPTSAVMVGVLAGAMPYFACTKLKSIFGYDDALDTFGVHAVGGTLGAFLTGIFADPVANGNLTTNLKTVVGHTLWLEQLKAMGITIVMGVVATVILGFLVKAVIGLRPTKEVEYAGLDWEEHGEPAYHNEA